MAPPAWPNRYCGAQAAASQGSRSAAEWAKAVAAPAGRAAAGRKPQVTATNRI